MSGIGGPFCHQYARPRTCASWAVALGMGDIGLTRCTTVSGEIEPLREAARMGVRAGVPDIPCLTAVAYAADFPGGSGRSAAVGWRALALRHSLIRGEPGAASVGELRDPSPLP
jgi:hypothetical protein